MIELYHRLTDWVVAFAESDWALLILAANSFTESIFFPVPPDLLLIGIAILDTDRALWLAGLVTATSVAGAVIGHWLGGRFGRPLLHRLVARSKTDAVERLFQRYGVWAVLIAAFTPIPYKVFAIAAGALDLDRRRFILASLAGRGARFFAIGVLIFVFGEDIEEFIENNFGLLTIAAGVVLLAGLGIAAVIARHRTGNTVA